MQVRGLIARGDQAFLIFKAAWREQHQAAWPVMTVPDRPSQAFQVASRRFRFNRWAGPTGRLGCPPGGRGLAAVGRLTALPRPGGLGGLRWATTGVTAHESPGFGNSEGSSAANPSNRIG